LTGAEFQRVTGERAFPASLTPVVRQGRLEYFCNDSAEYVLKGIHTSLTVEWKYEAAEGEGDTDLAVVRGSNARIELRQGAEEKFRPEVYVVPNRPELAPIVQEALKRKLEKLGKTYPGIGMKDLGGRFQVTIPDVFRIGHEAHFSLVGRRFLGYVKDPAALPSWEDSFMLAKYYTTTRAVELAKAHSAAR
jgi:hypothetical protein